MSLSYTMKARYGQMDNLEKNGTALQSETNKKFIMCLKMESIDYKFHTIGGTLKCAEELVLKCVYSNMSEL